jgi:hypothetical protein
MFVCEQRTVGKHVAAARKNVNWHKAVSVQQYYVRIEAGA